ncbi:MAG: endolytic transglycosylase MltG [Candidatus Pacebacteria bacterium]|nr:endolytic transglycosylase MltG [Candidatus Paceibacterota bacterium]
MKKNLTVILIILMVAIISWLILIPRKSCPQQAVLFNVEKGEGSRDIALNLEKQGLIWSAPFFRVYVLFMGTAQKLQAGTYSFYPSMKMTQIADKLAKGETAKAKITIPEGLTAEEIYQKLKEVSGVDPEELGNFEGYLFPDTYEISYGADSKEIIAMMTANFNRKVTADLREEISRQGKTLEDIVVMASLLEKEVKTQEEKELASGILWKRLRIGMALQVDAATTTYEKLGLPEKPICNPGLVSILSAVYPKDSNFWYYLSTPDGETIFSRTLEEHNLAKYQYLK